MTFLEFAVNDNRVSLPIWSSKSRVQRLKKLNPGLITGVEPRGISWEKLNCLRFAFIAANPKY